MQSFKIVVIAVGTVTLGVAALLGASGLYAYTIFKSAPGLTVADIEPGGSYPPAEREALAAACKNGFGTSESCACLAEKAGTVLSRFERLYLTATFEMSPTRMVGLAAAAGVGGIPENHIDKVAETIESRLQPVMASCGWNG